MYQGGVDFLTLLLLFALIWLAMSLSGRRSGGLCCDQLRLVAEAIAAPDGVGAARTHGELWNGNVILTPDGAVLIDPAVQGGHCSVPS